MTLDIGIELTEKQFVDTPGDDGIHRDGSFLQHDGLLYNGNYGKDLVRYNLF